MRIARGSFIVVADGRKAMFFRNNGEADYPNLELETEKSQPGLKDREIKSDAPGRTTGGNAQGVNAFEEPNFQQLEEERFAGEIADLLRQKALQAEFDALIIIAPPKVLGDMRKHYHKEVESRLKAEINKDLTGHPVKKIEEILIAA